MVACVPYTLCGTRGGGSHTYHTVVDEVSKLHFQNSPENTPVMESFILKTPFSQSSGWLCLFISLLIPFWLIHFFSPTPALSTIYRLWSRHMCSITPGTAKVGSSFSHLWGPGISSADSQTVNSVQSCWFWNQHHQQHQQQQHRYDNRKPVVAN